MGIQRRVALIGSGAGPWISTHGLREPRAKVTGLKAGGCLIVVSRDEENNLTVVAEVRENGIFELREAGWMRVSCDGGGRNVICDILTKKAVA